MDFNDPHLLSKERMAKRLSLVGVAPFGLLAVLLVWSHPGEPGWDGTVVALRGYAIVILSFIAGIRWGAAFQSDKAPRLFVLSIFPALIAWGTVFLAPIVALAILAMVFAAHGAWDVIAAQNGEVPGWYGELRMRITVLVVGMLLIAILAHGWSA
jgi:Protein of unknown function (DUF3429)